MATFVLIHPTVCDFDGWRSAYNARLAMRKEAELKKNQLLRSASDTNEVVIHFGAKDIHRAKTFWGPTDLLSLTQNAGVSGKTDIDCRTNCPAASLRDWQLIWRQGHSHVNPHAIENIPNRALCHATQRISGSSRPLQ